MQRIGLAIKPVDSKGRFDERGNEYDLGNELAGIAGLRRVDVDPKNLLIIKSLHTKKVLEILEIYLQQLH